MQLTVSQIAAQIAAQATSLESIRRKFFLEWMQAHSSQVSCMEENYSENHLKSTLMIWFKSLTTKGVFWEYRLILGEIAWWRALDGRSLGMVMDATDGSKSRYSSSKSFN